MILLDTNVISELMRPRPSAAVQRWFLLHEDEAALSTIAIAELSYGVAKLPPGARRDGLRAQLDAWKERYAARCVGFGLASAERYGELMAAARARGRPMSVPDGQIAAQVIEHGAALATRNGADFEGSGVAIIDPWSQGGERYRD